MPPRSKNHKSQNVMMIYDAWEVYVLIYSDIVTPGYGTRLNLSGVDYIIDKRLRGSKRQNKLNAYRSAYTI